jgi:putative FmdB family regulatory protein
MPLYEYRCDACGKRFEVIQKFSDGAPEACRLCGQGPVHRQASSPAIQFKGSGFYITDYAQKGRAEGQSGTDAAGAAAAASTGETKSTEGKSTESKSTESASSTTTPSAPAVSTPKTASTPKTSTPKT